MTLARQNCSALSLPMAISQDRDFVPVQVAPGTFASVITVLVQQQTGCKLFIIRQIMAVKRCSIARFNELLEGLCALIYLHFASQWRRLRSCNQG